MGPIIALLGLFFLISPLILLLLAVSLQGRQKRLEARFRELADQLDDRTLALKRRLGDLEARLGVSPAPAGMAEDEAPAEPAAPAKPVAAPPPVPPVEPTATPAALDAAAPPTAARPSGAVPDDVVPPAAAPADRAVPPVATRTAAARKPRPGLRPAAGTDWEEVIGGDWLNKLGALVLVVGIALLLAYSVARMGPAGRVALGLAVSIGMLVTGVITERREQYRVFAQGLLGGGWAGLYFTTYAMHGLEAARIIDSPVIGTALLLAVAAGMVAHSLHYRSQAITGLAYFIVFVTLAISPLSRFALIASVPAAVSLLFVAQRFGWERMAIGGLLLSYGSFLFRYEGLQAVSPGPPDWAFGQALLLIYWLIFEAFDLVSLVRGRSDEIAYTLFPLNAVGFLGISIIEWQQASAANLWLFFSLAGVAFLASALLRARFVPAVQRPAGAPADFATMTYEAAITVAAVLFAFGIHLRFDGWQQTVAWLLEAQMLFLSGLLLRQGYLRRLGSIAMMLPVLAVIAVDSAMPGQIEVAGMTLRQGTPVALLTAAALYGSRALLRVSRSLSASGAEKLFTSFASLILALIIGHEAPTEYAALGWLALAIVLFETSMPARLVELRYQAYAVSAIAWIDILAAAGLDVLPSPERIWTLLVPAAALSYGAALRLYLRPARIDEGERSPAFDLSSLAGSVIVALAVWHMAPVAWVAVGWLLLGLLLVEVGLAAGEPSLRSWGHIALIAAFGRVFMGNLDNLGDSYGISHRLLTVGPMIAAYYYLAARFRGHTEDATTMSFEPGLRRLYLYLAAILGAVLVRFELGRAEAVLGWTAMSLALLYVGQRRDNGDLRLQAYGLAILVFARAWAINFYVPGTILGVDGPLLTGVLVTAGLFAAHFMVPRERELNSSRAGVLDRLIAWFDEHARSALSLLATILLAAFLFYEVSGSLLTVAWGLQGTGLLIAGFALRDRQLRLSGLVLLGVCIGKAFFYDFNQLDVVFRIVSFLVLGSLLLAVSFVYTRYREQLQRWL
jgi:uncharacterized membrane protein